MTAKIYAMVPAMVLALGASTALAHPTTSPRGQASQVTVAHSASLPSGVTTMNIDYVGNGAAHIGGGGDPSYQSNQQRLMREPGYSVGTGAAQVGDGASPSYESDQRQLRHAPGFRYGEGAAELGDGTNSAYRQTNRQLQNEPGYSIGTGAAPVHGAL